MSKKKKKLRERKRACDGELKTHYQIMLTQNSVIKNIYIMIHLGNFFRVVIKKNLQPH